MGRRQESQFDEVQRLCRERDASNSQIVQMRRALEQCAEGDGPGAQAAKDSIDQLERSGVW